MPTHHPVLIIDGGTAGNMVASQLIRQKKRTSVAIIEPAEKHWRLWMLKKYMLPYLYWNKMMQGQDV